MRTAAARLVLGLAAAREKIGSSLVLRRSSGTLAEADVWKKAGMLSGSELNKEKSLYLCFFESSLGVDGVACLNNVVRPIRLNSDDDGKEEELSEAAYMGREGFEKSRFSGRFGSQILYPSERDISRVDTSTRPIQFQKFKEFSSPKNDPVLGEINGKLYCFDINLDNPFEVLDLPKDEWRPLDNPPFIKMRNLGPCCASILEESNKILAWEIGKTGVYCYDPEKGWKESAFSLSNALPFLGYNGRPPIFIHHHHPHLGDFYLIFNYYPRNGPLLISPFFMSHDCDSIQPIQNEPIQLPQELLSNFIPFLGGSHLEKPIYTDYEFVHLGGQKVCLVLTIFFSDDPVEGKNKGIIHLITFEYDIIPNRFEVDIRTRLLSTSRFRYHSEHLHDKEVDDLNLTGAFVL